MLVGPKAIRGPIARLFRTTRRTGQAQQRLRAFPGEFGPSTNGEFAQHGEQELQRDCNQVDAQLANLNVIVIFGTNSARYADTPIFRGISK